AFESLPEQVQPRVKIAGESRWLPQVKPTPERATLLLTRRSLPLVQLLKLMNVHSNNAMSEQLVDQLGGGPAIARQLAQSMDFPAGEIQLINGSGLGVENKMSPRAATALALRLSHQLRYPDDGAPAYTLADILPISGFDRGSIRTRKMPIGSTVKTGTLNAVSALSGLLPTETHDALGFAIINGGLPRILRINQDRLLANLQTQWGQPAKIPAVVTSILKEPTLGDRRRTVIPPPVSPSPQ
ncbi:MAG: D-alanyl-D-alanine carboxypeptidase, partial [Cyanobacteria bacterium P01_H01_bin.130]